MNKELDELNDFFTSRTVEFKTTISRHEGRFNEQDHIDFENLIEEIKNYASLRISNFF